MSLDFSFLRTETVFDINVTHNLVPMWKEAGVYDCLYNSERLTPAMILPILEIGLAYMKAQPERFKALNPSNGWGSYENAIGVLEAIISACRQHPKSKIEISA